MRTKLSFLTIICLLLIFATGMTAAADYNEVPMLEDLVAEGLLEPVEERLPEEPLVIEPNHEIGQYGGRLILGNEPQIESNLILNRPATDTEPNIIKDWEFADEGRELTLYLRKGLKWSDGEPVTADDYLFQFYDIDLNEELNPVTPGHIEILDDELIEMIKVDDFTVRMEFPVPFYGIINKMNMVGARNWYGPAPRHFLEEYHIDYNENADQIAQEAGFETWYDYFSLIENLEDDEENIEGYKLGRPSLDPWVLKQETPTTYMYERNPYYFKVDPAGNQLPYIDEYHWDLIDDREIRIMKTISGEFDFEAWGLTLEEFPLLKANEDQGNYNAWMGEGLAGAEAVLCINQSYKPEEETVLGKLLQTLEFRQALSLAIDRNEMNELIYLGQAVPRQATVHPDTPGYKEEWAESYAEYDPERANELLDEIGLEERTSDGWRKGEDGEPISIELFYHEGAGWIAPLELVRSYWRDIGIDVNMRAVGAGVLFERVNAYEVPVFAWVLDRVHGPSFVESNGSWLNPEFWFGPISPAWEDWLINPDTGVEPPDLVKELVDIANEMQFVDQDRQKEIVQTIGDAYAENLWMIGTVGLAGTPIVAKKDLGNVREDAYPDNIDVGGLRNHWMEQWYWKQ